MKPMHAATRIVLASKDMASLKHFGMLHREGLNAQMQAPNEEVF